MARLRDDVTVPSFAAAAARFLTRSGKVLRHESVFLD
jgi:hypothetical protein